MVASGQHEGQQGRTHLRGVRRSGLAGGECGNVKFIIDISDDGFFASKDDEVIAQSRSGEDLLKVLNQVINATSESGLELVYKVKEK